MQACEVPAWGWMGGRDLQQACQGQLLLRCACEAQCWTDLQLPDAPLTIWTCKSMPDFNLILATWHLLPACPNSRGSQLKPYQSHISGGSSI